MDEKKIIALTGKESRFKVLKQWPITLALVTIAVGFIGIITISCVYGLKGGEYFDDYGVVMDAGSSKTNTIVYKWKSNKRKGTARVSQEGNCYVKGGIAEMNPKILDKIFDCAKNVTSFIKPQCLSKTPLFFAATAGMRLLNLTNPSKVDAILEQLAIELPKTGMDVKAIEIIPGEDEGIYGWITTNYLLETLEIPQKADPWEPTTYGAMDMGGASTQIAYAASEEKTKGNIDVSKIQLYQQTHNVISRSNLCFGRDQANGRYRSLLLLKRNGTIVEDPCAPEGYVNYATGEQLFAPICANYSSSEYNMSQVQNVNFTYVGTSDPISCHQHVSDLLNDSLCRELNFIKCFKNDLDIPDDQKFIAFSNYYYTTKFLNLTESTLEEYETTMRDFCKKDLSEIKNITNNTYGPEYCFNANYLYQILVHGLGFNNKTWKNLEFKESIGNEDFEWTLGYITYATNGIPMKATPRLISKITLIVSIGLIVLVAATIVIFLVYKYKRSTG